MELEFTIEDLHHCEPMGRFRNLEDAMAEVRRLASLPLNAEPNRAPCTNWRNCGRKYELQIYRRDSGSLRLVAHEPLFEIGASGVVWHLSRLH